MTCKVAASAITIGNWGSVPISVSIPRGVSRIEHPQINTSCTEQCNKNTSNLNKLPHKISVSQLNVHNSIDMPDVYTNEYIFFAKMSQCTVVSYK